MWETSVSSKETTASQIKGEKQLPVLTDSVKLMSYKFDEYEKDKKAKVEVITKRRTHVTTLTDTVIFCINWQAGAILQAKLPANTWCWRNQNEDTDTLTIIIINEHL